MRLGVVLAYSELRDANVAWFLNDSDANVAREAAMAINDAPIEAAYAALAAKLGASADEQRRIADLLRKAANAIDELRPEGPDTIDL